ncbi:hypothetical protein ACFQT0_01455 [Hymenobacter humi]|uniref:Lipoprotein n=1 Tax=Hymenobacter humi TaxID=1411620 RepID=A0ABW2TYP2_9BACT
MRLLATLGLALLSLTVASCGTTTCIDEPQPQPPCLSGVVVGDACLDGVLIDVDAAFPIGKPTGRHDNVIAAVNFADLASLNQVGQRVYFTSRNDPARQSAARFCTANTFPLPVPRLVLSNISATACGKTGPQ